MLSARLSPRLAIGYEIAPVSAARSCCSTYIAARASKFSIGNGSVQELCEPQLRTNRLASTSFHSWPLQAYVRPFIFNKADLVPEDVETCCEDIRDDVLQQCPQQQMQRGSQQERLPGLPRSLQKLQFVFLHGIKNLSAGSRVDDKGYRWVYACLAVLVWRQVLQANLQLAAEEAVWDSFASKMASEKHRSGRRHKRLKVSNEIYSLVSRRAKRGDWLDMSNFFNEAAREAASRPPPTCQVRLAETGLSRANRHLRRAAEDFALELLKVVNQHNSQPGLAFDRLPVTLQLFVFSLLQQCGCVNAWGLPVYRQLPAAAAGIRPGRIVAIGLQQYLDMLQHLPAICMDQMDGTWSGDAQVRLHDYQVVTLTELSKALGASALQRLIAARSGFAADLVATAAELGILDEATTATASRMISSRSLAELLLLKFYKTLMGLHAAAVVSMCRVMSQQAGQTSRPAFNCHPMHTATFCSACGGSGGSGRRGSITAVGAADDDESASADGLVPLSRDDRHRACDRPAVAAVAAGKEAGAVQSRKSRRGILQRAGAVVRFILRRE